MNESPLARIVREAEEFLVERYALTCLGFGQAGRYIARLAARHAAHLALEEAAKIAKAQEEHWREELRARGNYRVLAGISECQRVAEAICALKEE